MLESFWVNFFHYFRSMIFKTSWKLIKLHKFWLKTLEFNNKFKFWIFLTTYIQLWFEYWQYKLMIFIWMMHCYYKIHKSNGCYLMYYQEGISFTKVTIIIARNSICECELSFTDLSPNSWPSQCYIPMLHTAVWLGHPTWVTHIYASVYAYSATACVSTQYSHVHKLISINNSFCT